MASSSTICASCLRAMRPARIARQTAPPNPLRNASRSYRTTPATSHKPIHQASIAPTAVRISPRIPFPLQSSVRTQSALPTRTYATAATSSQTQSAPDTPPPTPAPSHIARAIANPRTDENGDPMTISISPRACARLSQIMAKDGNPNQALRVTIESGGCHGFQYLMNLEDLNEKPVDEEDSVFEGDKGAKVVIDEASLGMLQGSTVDYSMELIGSQFKVVGIKGATSSCGCGTSFDIKF